MVDILVSGQGQVTLIQVQGRVDSMTANQLGEALTKEIDGGNINVVLDLSSVDYMSSAGLREIVTALKKAKRATGDLRLAQPSDRVREVLEMAGLDTIFRIYTSQAEAVGSF
jgi:anti-sigma B factor antagonist